jgi:hypothetical protein
MSLARRAVFDEFRRPGSGPRSRVEAPDPRRRIRLLGHRAGGAQERRPQKATDVPDSGAERESAIVDADWILPRLDICGKPPYRRKLGSCVFQCTNDLGSTSHEIKHCLYIIKKISTGHSTNPDDFQPILWLLLWKYGTKYVTN